MKPVLDACCGSRMFWFDREDSRTIFLDNRIAHYKLPDKSSKGGSRRLVIDPDVLGDFTKMPFENESFHLVVFDPPHLKKVGASSWLAKKYGRLLPNWKEEISKGFRECFRVLKPHGTLIFKWNETDIKVSEVLALSPVSPLFGNRCGKASKSHWICFIKPPKN